MRRASNWFIVAAGLGLMALLTVLVVTSAWGVELGLGEVLTFSGLGLMVIGAAWQLWARRGDSGSVAR